MNSSNIVYGIEYVGVATNDPGWDKRYYGAPTHKVIVSGHIVHPGEGFSRKGTYWFIHDSCLDGSRYEYGEPVTVDLVQRFWTASFPKSGYVFIDCREGDMNTEHSATPVQERFVLIVWDVLAEGTDKVYLFESEKEAYKLKQFLEENSRVSTIYPVRVCKED